MQREPMENDVSDLANENLEKQNLEVTMKKRTDEIEHDAPSYVRVRLQQAIGR